MKHYRFIILVFLGLILAQSAVAQGYAEAKAEADKALSTRNLAEAIPAFQKLVSDYPEQVEAYNALGFALYLDGQFDQAIEVFEQALKRAPSDDAARRNLILAGGRRALESSYGSGQDRIRTLYQRFPDHPQLAVLDFYAGKLHYLYGFTNLAFASWERVSRSRPDSGTALFLKAVKARRDRNAPEQNRLFREALKKMPQEEVFRLWAARHLIEGNDNEGAAALLAPLADRRILSPGVAIALSRFERMRGRTLQAFGQLKKASEVPEVLLEKALMTQQLGGSAESTNSQIQDALDAGGERALIVLSDEPGAKVYLDGTLLGSPPLGLFAPEGAHELRMVYSPSPVLVSRFKTPQQGMILFQGGTQTGLDIRKLPSRSEMLP